MITNLTPGTTLYTLYECDAYDIICGEICGVDISASCGYNHTNISIDHLRTPNGECITFNPYVSLTGPIDKFFATLEEAEQAKIQKERG